jgi:disulfide bond formation protein DsbB
MTDSTHEAAVREQLKTLIGLYEHHLDLFWRWITLYVTIAAGLGAYIFNKDIATSTKPLFPALIGVASLGLTLGCGIMLSWLRSLEREVKRLAHEVDEAYPSFLGTRMTLATLIVSFGFAVFSFLYARFGWLG